MGHLAVSQRRRGVAATNASTLAAPAVGGPAVLESLDKRESFVALPRAERIPISSSIAAWLRLGAQEQVAPGASDVVPIVVGLDFGTAFTKASVGLLDKLLPVDWSGLGLASGANYLLPSEFVVDGSSACVLAVPKSSAAIRETATDLKLPLLRPDVAAIEVERATIFLALVLQYVRAWIFEKQAGKLQGRRIRWLLNLGTPCNGWETSDVKRRYQTIAEAAWLLSLAEIGTITYELASSVVSDVTRDPGSDALPVCEVIPEFVAQLASYMQSPQRQDGLHALADVGGGTLDFVTFNVVVKEGDQRFPFLVPEVKPLGVHTLLSRRIAECGVESQLPADVDDVVDPTAFAKFCGCALETVEKSDDQVRDEVSSLGTSVLSRTKSRRDPLSQNWKGVLRLFLTGGGSTLEVYKNGVAGLSFPGSGQLIVETLQPHPSLDEYAGEAETYHRISVACGLALDPFSLGKVVPASEVGDFQVPRTAVARPDRDELWGG